MSRILGFSFLACCGLFSISAYAATPCDFKGLSVGDKVSPQEIMRHYGIENFTIEDEQSKRTPQTDAEFKALTDRANEVNIINAQEEREWAKGPVCGSDYCRIPSGVEVGNEPYPIPVQLFIGFDRHDIVTEIDITFDHDSWDDIILILNNKYGDSWKKETSELPTYDFQNKSSGSVTQIVLTHRNPGRNPKTGDACEIFANAYDTWFVHSMEPNYRANVVIKLISRNF